MRSGKLDFHILSRTVGHCAAVAVLCLAGMTGAQEITDIRFELGSSGAVHVKQGNAHLASAFLSAHGPKWAYASQEDAAAKQSGGTHGGGKHFEGTIQVPRTDGGAIQYVQTVTSVSNGLRIEYELTMLETMKLNGLQVCFNLPVEQYAGDEVLVSQLRKESDMIELPVEPRSDWRRSWSGQGTRIEVAKGTGKALTIELRAATDIMVQDLRRWDNPTFEISLPAMMHDENYEVAKGDKFHIDFTLTCPPAE